MSLEITALPTKKNNLPQRAIMKKNIIPRHPGVSIFNGRIGSGKSMLMLNLLNKPQFYGPKKEGSKAYFTRVIVFSPTCKSDDLYETIDKSVLKESDMHDDLDPNTLQEIIDTQKGLVKSKGIDKTDRILFIFDDCAAEQKFLNSKPFREAITAGRHLNSSSWIATQSFTMIPRKVRLQAKYIFYFEGSESEDALIATAYAVKGLNKREMFEIIHHAVEGDFNFLFINQNASMNIRFRKNLTKILKIN